MARLRLFANLREVAGTTEMEVEAATVGEALDAAIAIHGPAFAAGLETARVWVNGDQADRSTPVSAGDEIALIPPVSGGEMVAEPSTQAFQAVLVLSLLGAVVIANLVSLEIFAFVVVGAGLAWMWDIADTVQQRGRHLNMIPPLVAVAAAVNGAYRWGLAGFAGGVVLGLMVALTWSVFDARQRSLRAVAATALLAVVGGLGAGSLVLTRMRSTEEVSAALAVAGTGAVAAWLAHHYGDRFTFADPNLAAIVGSIGAGLVAGLVAGVLDLPVTLLASAGAAAGMIAGRTFGSIVRTGEVAHTSRAPGLLTMFDGPYLAVTLFWIALLVFG